MGGCLLLVGNSCRVRRLAATGRRMANARFSEVLDQRRRWPQTITRNDRWAAVIVSVGEWERRTSRTGTLAELHRGVYRLCSGRCRDALHDWVKTDLVARFDQRILTVN